MRIPIDLPSSSDSAVDFVALARAHGVAGAAVEGADDIADALRAVMDRGKPYLLEVPLARE